MPSKKPKQLWPAEPHTIAKISILSKYLEPYFRIIGCSRSCDFLYVDGFAGPGKYTNHPEGSPIAALKNAQRAIDASGDSWKAGCVHFVFIEKEKLRHSILLETIKPFLSDPRFTIHVLHDEFAKAFPKISELEPASRNAVTQQFFFVDPFGATGVPFRIIRDILVRPHSELLLNLDTDGILRILGAGKDAGAPALLTEIFGDDDWQRVLTDLSSTDDNLRKVYELYRRKLHGITGVDYVFPFEMRDVNNAHSYFLVFASKNLKGLEKMKEAMKSLNQDGSYRFSDGMVGQEVFLRFDDPTHAADEMVKRLGQKKYPGRTWTVPELKLYTLNETLFINPARILKLLEADQRIEVIEKPGVRRRKGTFTEDQVAGVRFTGRRTAPQDGNEDLFS